MKKIKLADIQNRIQTVSLSEALQHYKLDDDKISLVQKSIKTINCVSSRFYNIQSLFLSGNFIASLENIGQFKMLKNLSLANNSISDIFQLNYLAELTRLENISLQSNPVSKHLFYRCWVVVHCKCLRNFDSVSVNNNEHKQLSELFTLVNQKFQKMIKNYWTMEKMCNYAKKIDIHRQINKKQQCCTLKKYNRFMKLCHVNQNVKIHIWLNLYEDCVVIYNSLSSKQRLIECIDLLMSKQIDKIRELQSKLIKKLQNHHSHQTMSDSDLFQQMQSRLTNNHKATNARYLWLKLNTFLILKHNAKTAINDRRTLQRKKKSKINHSIAVNILQDSMKNNMRIAFKTIRNCQPDQRSQIIKQKRQNKQLLSKFITIWKDQYFKKRIENQTKMLCSTFEQMKAKQSRYLQKIQLLQEYNRVLKHSHAKQIEDLNMTKRTMTYQSISELTNSKISYYGLDKENQYGTMNRKQRVLNRSPCKQIKKRDFIYREE